MLADRVSKLTDDKFQIRVFVAGEIAPGLQALDSVQSGSVDCCHTNSYYYVGKNMEFRKIYTPWRKSRDDSQAWFGIAEQSYDTFASANKV